MSLFQLGEWGRMLPSPAGGQWQCLEIFLVMVAGGEGATAI